MSIQLKSPGLKKLNQQIIIKADSSLLFNRKIYAKFLTKIQDKF